MSMEPTKRIILNTAVQYTRSILNILLSLFSTRYIIEALGESDYGLYVLVGGVVALLGFVTNSLVITTQRFVSYYYGKADVSEVRKVFANSLFVHFVLAAGLTALLLCIKNLFVFQWLNIPEGREAVANQVYILAVFLLLTTIISAPFKALFIARENITYISILEVCDGCLKLCTALWVLYTDNDRLLQYAFLILMIQIFNLLAMLVYALRKYEECRVPVSCGMLDFKFVRKMAGFAGWLTYSTGSVVLRSQGIQFFLNRIYGTVINAAYGIATQVYASIAFVSTSILNAMNPQIVKAAGEGNHKKMLYLAEMESKYSTMLLMLIVVPIIFEVPGVLSFWLKDVPEGAEMFCRFLLCCLVVDQFTYSMNTVNQAMGKIKNYTLLTYTPKVLVLLPIYYVLAHGQVPFVVMCIHLVAEILVAVIRLPYMKYTAGLSIAHFLRTVVLSLIPLLVAQCVVGGVCVSLVDMEYRFIVTISLSLLVSGFVLWLFVLSKAEREYVLGLIRCKLHK